MNDGLNFWCLIRPLKTSKQYIAISETGRIEGTTFEIGQELKIAGSGSSAAKTRIRHVCPKFPIDYKDRTIAFSMKSDAESQVF